MLDIGDTVTLTTTPLDAAGNPTTVSGGLSVSVTLPDGTTTTPVDATGDGPTCQFEYVTEQAGRHVARWSGDGFAESDVFNVWPADPRFLFSLGDAKRSLRQGSRAVLPSSDDEDIRLYIASATYVIEDIVGPLAGGEVSISRDGSAGAVFVPPNVAITSVVENGVELVAGEGYTFNASAGIVYGGCGYTGSRFARGRQNVVVTYRGVGLTPPNIILAAREEFRFLWQIGQQGPRMGGGDAMVADEFTPSGFAVPRRVIELCGSRMPVIA